MMDEQGKPKYLIVCLRHKNMLSPDLLLFWGKNRSGYVSSVYNAGLYSAEDVEQICDYQDIPMPIDFLGIEPEKVLNSEWNEEQWLVIYKSGRVLKFIDKQVTKYRIKHRLKKRKQGRKVALG